MPDPDDGSGAAPARGGWHLGALIPAVIGLGVAIYLTIEHYDSSATLACPESATINCQKVTTSSYSHVGPIPVALAGLLYFAVMLALVSPPAWRVPVLGRLRLAGAAVGIVTVVYLVCVELFAVDAICLWCTAVHVCMLALFAAVLWYWLGEADQLAA